jgi:hypothetical protein
MPEISTEVSTMVRPLSIYRRLILSAALLLSIAAQPVRAADVGARVYVQLWIPEAAAEDQVQTPYDDMSIVSDSVKKAWTSSKNILRGEIFIALNGYRVAPGMTQKRTSVGCQSVLS